MGFPAGPGRELVFTYCGNCHELTLLQGTKLDKDGWIEKQVSHPGGDLRDAGMSNEEIEAVAEYLATYYSPIQ